jgi:hypothetical protein
LSVCPSHSNLNDLKSRRLSRELPLLLPIVTFPPCPLLPPTHEHHHPHRLHLLSPCTTFAAFFKSPCTFSPRSCPYLQLTCPNTIDSSHQQRVRLEQRISYLSTTNVQRLSRVIKHTRAGSCSTRHQHPAPLPMRSRGAFHARSNPFAGGHLALA